MARAVVLAGGLGARLAPYTTILPKPLMPLGQHSIIERLISDLVASGLTDVTISLGYLGHLVEAVVGDGTALGAHVSYTRESEPLGTAGALSLLGPIPPHETVLVVNGDTLTDLDFGLAIKELEARQAQGLVVCVERTTTLDYGVVHYDERGWLLEYEEKPVLRRTVSTGIYALTGAAISAIPAGRIDMPDVLGMLHAAGSPVACLTVDCGWWDLGRPEDLAAANARIAAAGERAT